MANYNDLTQGPDGLPLPPGDDDGSLLEPSEPAAPLPAAPQSRVEPPQPLPVAETSQRPPERPEPSRELLEAIQALAATIAQLKESLAENKPEEPKVAEPLDPVEIESPKPDVAPPVDWSPEDREIKELEKAAVEFEERKAPEPRDEPQPSPSQPSAPASDRPAPPLAIEERAKSDEQIVSELREQREILSRIASSAESSARSLERVEHLLLALNGEMALRSGGDDVSRFV